MAKKKPTPVPEPEPAPPLRLEYRSPAELAENPRNWRRHPPGQVAALTDVIAEVGWAGACLFNEATGRLIDGHARRKVALEQGADKVPVLVGSWTEEQEAKILATLDPIGAMATADAASLDALLREVTTSSEAVSLMLGQLAADSNLYQVNGSGEPDDPAEHWQGMPEFEQEDQESWKRLIVHFKNRDDYEAFARLIGQSLTEKTRSIWYPQAEIVRYMDKSYTDEPEVPGLCDLEGSVGVEANEQGS